MKTYDLVCVGMALVDSIIKGFDPNPVSASGYRAASGSLNVGGEAVRLGGFELLPPVSVPFRRFLSRLTCCPRGAASRHPKT